MEKEYLNDEDEQQHFDRIVKSFKAYQYKFKFYNF